MTFHPSTNGKNSIKRRQNADGKGIFAQIQALKHLTVTLKMEAAHYSKCQNKLMTLHSVATL
jgi:hypothetical protein